MESSPDSEAERTTPPPLHGVDNRPLIERLKIAALKAYASKEEQTVVITPDERDELIDTLRTVTIELSNHVAHERSCMPPRIRLKLEFGTVRISILHF